MRGQQRTMDLLKPMARPKSEYGPGTSLVLLARMYTEQRCNRCARRISPGGAKFHRSRRLGTPKWCASPDFANSR